MVATQFTDALGRETLAASHRQLRGYLVDIDGDVIRELSAPQLGKPDKACCNGGYVVFYLIVVQLNALWVVIVKCLNCGFRLMM